MWLGTTSEEPWRVSWLSTHTSLAMLGTTATTGRAGGREMSGDEGTDGS